MLTFLGYHDLRHGTIAYKLKLLGGLTWLINLCGNFFISQCRWMPFIWWAPASPLPGHNCLAWWPLSTSFPVRAEIRPKWFLASRIRLKWVPGSRGHIEGRGMAAYILGLDLWHGLMVCKPKQLGGPTWLINLCGASFISQYRNMMFESFIHADGHWDRWYRLTSRSISYSLANLNAAATGSRFQGSIWPSKVTHGRSDSKVDVTLRNLVTRQNRGNLTDRIPTQKPIAGSKWITVT